RCSDLKTELARRFLGLAHFQYGGGIVDVGHNRQPAQIGYHLAQQIESFAGNIRCLVHQTSDVATRSRQTRDQASPDWVRYHREHDRDDRRRLLCREGCWGCHRDNHIDLAPDKLGRDFDEALSASLCPAILNRKVATVDPGEFTESLHKSGNPVALNRRVGTQESDGRYFARLLRPHRERPRGCRAAEQRDEVATVHLRGHSITSSTLASSCGGTSRPSALAVCRLMANSNLVDCNTGSSAGLAPLMMLPV